MVDIILEVGHAVYGAVVKGDGIITQLINTLTKNNIEGFTFFRIGGSTDWNYLMFSFVFVVLEVPVWVASVQVRFRVETVEATAA